jgi:hypothetical protein
LKRGELRFESLLLFLLTALVVGVSLSLQGSLLTYLK